MPSLSYWEITPILGSCRYRYCVLIDYGSELQVYLNTYRPKCTVKDFYVLTGHRHPFQKHFSVK